MNEIISEFSVKIEVLKFKYENLFKNSDKTPSEFLNQNIKEIQKEFAKISTDSIYFGFQKGFKSQEFIYEVLSLNFQNIEELKNKIKKS